MKNNNQAIIRKITKRSLKSNKTRNIFIIAAIMLTALLLSFVFSVGISFVESQRMQEMRLMGSVAHAAVNNPIESELEQLRAIDYVKMVGTGNYIAQIINTPEMGDMNLGFYYFDEIQFTEMRLPAYTDFTGNYPHNDNEIMIPIWVLERLGITPEIGMEIPLSYAVVTDNDYLQYDEIFVLSGWFESYMHIRSGNIDSILTSEEFTRRHNKTPESNGSAVVIFDSSSRVNEYCQRLEQDLGISDSQRIRAVPMYDISASDSASAFIALSLVIAFLILIGYLLIYNVLFISVSRDVRFYGLLKTIGTTPRQIRKIMTGQILRLCMIGIPPGLALASLLSLAVVPALVAGMSNIETGTVISFSPLIYVGATFFSLLTAFLGAIKPAKKAAEISPIEAQKYTGAGVNKRKVRSFAYGKPHKMAIRNIFRDRKRAAIVLLSLFLGVTTFTTITAIVGSMDPDNYAALYIKNDFILTNNTIAGAYENTSKQKFDDDFLSMISALPGFESMSYDTYGWFHLTYDDGFDAHLSNITSNEPDISSEAINRIKDYFTCIAAGIDAIVLTELDEELDIDSFDRGDFILLSVTEPELYEDVAYVEINDNLSGASLAEVTVGGYVPILYRNVGYSAAPTLFMSNNLMENLTGGAIRSRLYIDVVEGYDKQFFEALKSFTEGDFEISHMSKIEAREDLRDDKIMMYVFGGGIAFVLGLIGVLNFVNVMSVGIVVRKREFAALESIGMSRKQMRSMLLCEGAGYALITLLLVAVVGNAVTYGVFKLFQQQASYAVFSYPLIPILITALAIIGVCIITPETAYRSVNKATLVERLREAE